MRRAMFQGIFFMLVLGLSSIPAKAQDFNPYIGFGLGGFELDYGNGSDFVFGGFGLLGLTLTENVALEGRVGGAGNKTKLDAQLGNLNVKKELNWFVSYLVKPQFEISEGLRIYGLLGGTTLRTAITPTGSVKRTSTDTSFSFGLGGEYGLDPQLYLGIEWMRYASNKDRAVVNAGGFNGLDVNGFVGTLRYEF